MTIQQPTSTNTLNSPDHSLSHRVFANDDAAPVQSVVVDSSGTTTLNYGYVGNVTVVTNNYTVLVTDELVVCNKATAMTVVLPTAVVGQRFYIKSIGVGTVTVDGADGDTIDGETTQTINQYECLVIQCSAANTWLII